MGQLRLDEAEVAGTSYAIPPGGWGMGDGGAGDRGLGTGDEGGDSGRYAGWGSIDNMSELRGGEP
jgi:hypothetical protein